VGSIAGNGDPRLYESHMSRVKGPAIDLNKESIIVRYNSSLNVASLLENQFLKSICNVSFKKCSFDNAMIYIKHLSLSNPTHNDIVH
jgi:hypothetical protein